MKEICISQINFSQRIKIDDLIKRLEDFRQWGAIDCQITTAKTIPDDYTPTMLNLYRYETKLEILQNEEMELINRLQNIKDEIAAIERLNDKNK